MRGMLRAARIGVLLAAAATAALPALGFEFPLRILAPAAPGTGWDQLGHAIEEAAVGSGVVDRVEVSNVPGAGGTVGLAQFVRDAGPGEPLMVTGLAMVSGIMMNRSPVGLDRVTPIARLAAEHLVVVVSANSSIESVAAFADALKTDPEKVAWAGGPLGGVSHVAALLVARAMDADMSRLVYIPYLGSAEALAAVEEGKVAAAIVSYPELASDPKSGPLRVLAVTAPARIQGIDAPTLKEAGIDLEVANWRGVVAPTPLPPERRAALSDAFERLSRTPQWDAALKQRSWHDAFLPAEAFASFLSAEQVRVKEVLKASGLLKRAPAP